MIEKATYKLVGQTPLLMHAANALNPFNEYHKAMKKITGIRKKQEEDHLKLMELEFLSGLYLDDKNRPIIPGNVLMGGIKSAAKKFRQGRQADEGLWVENDAVLKFDGPKDLQKRFDKAQYLYTKVVLSGKSIMRTRPKFSGWSAEIEVCFQTDLINREDVDKWIKRLETMGIMDYRPQYGRFTSEAA